MNKLFLLAVLSVSLLISSAIPPMLPLGLNWEEVYHFDKCNVFVMEFYAKNNELMKTRHIKTFYQSNGENFLVQNLSEIKGNGTETIIVKAFINCLRYPPRSAMPDSARVSMITRK